MNCLGRAPCGRGAGLLLTGALLCLFTVPAVATEAPPQAEAGPIPEGRKLILATRNVPPFAIRSENGEWSGIVIDLWEEIAAELGLAYEFREVEIQEMIDGLSDGTFDAAVAALTMTAERERVIDFSHPYYSSGLGIAAPAKSTGGWLRMLQPLLSVEFAEAVAALAVLLLLVGLGVWLFERRRNAGQFGGGVAKGIGSSFWWSAVTMTTVGYGDKAPVTAGGRFLALVWMFASIIVISSFTAAIASALTVSQLGSGIAGPEDLPGLRVGTLRDSTSAAYLRRNTIQMAGYVSPEEALADLAAGNVDAVVYDAPILRYLVNHAANGSVNRSSEHGADLSTEGSADRSIRGSIRVLPREFEPQNYAIALPERSPLREPIDRIVLRKTAEPEWQDLLYRYLGE